MKKEKKLSKGEPFSSKPSVKLDKDSSDTNPSEISKRRTWRWIIIGVVVLVILLSLAGFFYRKQIFNQYALPGFGSYHSLTGKDLKKLMQPDKSVTKRIGKEGGSIVTTTSTGKYVTLTIPPGALKKETDISLTPIDESPVENYEPDNPGVIIGPPGINFNPPVIINIGNNPPPTGNNNPPGSNTPPGSNNPPGNNDDNVPDDNNQPGQDNNDQADDTSGSDQPGTDIIPNLNDSITGLGDIINAYDAAYGTGGVPAVTMEEPSGAIQQAKPNGSSASDPGQTATTRSGGNGNTVAIQVGYDGKVSVISTNPANHDGSVDIPVDESSAVSTDEPTKDESEELTDNEANNAGGQCTTEFLQTIAGYIRNGASAQDVASYRGLIEDCLDVDYLRDLCANDKIKLRRREFQWRIELASTIDPTVAQKIEQLKNSCGARYKLEASGTYAHQGSGATTTANLNATVCGYLDDHWSGPYSWRTELSGAGVESFSGNADFTLPVIGRFGIMVSNEGALTLHTSSGGINLPNFGWALWADFDGLSHVTSYLWSELITTSNQIVMIEPACDPQLPPLEPLPGDNNSNNPDSDNTLPPLAPLPTGQRNSENRSNNGTSPSESDEETPALVPLIDNSKSSADPDWSHSPDPYEGLDRPDSLYEPPLEPLIR